MSFLSALVLGLVQGLTEFLPVSSSGHLVIAQSFFPGFAQPGVLFDVVLHLGTTFAVLIFFWPKLIVLIKEDWLKLIIATIPAGLAGLLFQSQIELLFSNIRLVGFALILTAAMNYLTDRAKQRKKTVSPPDSLFIGLSQALAIVPGISRSGATIFAGSELGLKREKAASFSFLLSVPAILGANFLQLFKYGFEPGLDFGFYLLGFLSAFLAGLIAMKIVFMVLAKKKFRFFALYCLLLGALVILL